ncbi:two pore segment channel 3 isoform X3 [Kryptolebias marmoratus]|uniref:Two pore segment channel 3 n=1 Tax=Kryptolebias marmoratus TaxID=37003 RepID=A0A3Q3AQU5_KRYMA|nr:two pore segment channel 3 isoform X3 [Kryptolebias marmoratus]
MSEPEKSENIPDASAGKEVPNGGNSAKSKEDFDLAAVYVSDAMYNRNIYFDTSPQAIRLYLLYNHWALKVLLYVFILVNLGLAIFEEPAVFPLPTWATMLLELLCVFVFTFRIVHYAKVIPRDKFWKDPKNICIIVILLLTLVDMIIYGALRAANCSIIRWSRVLRPLLLVNVTEGRQLRRAFRSIRNALPQIFNVFLLFMFSLLMFSLMALKLLGKRNLKTIEGLPYFNNYLEIVFDLYVLVTTANSPDVMMPAYNSHSMFTLFFIVYILINTYIFMSVFLAVVYNNYKKYLKEEVRQLVRAKRHKMARAFAVLQEQKEDGGQPMVTQANWNQLVRQVRPDISNGHRELLWHVCDDKNHGFIGKGAFVQLADLLNIEVITLKSRPHPLQSLFPKIYQSAPSRLLCRMVQHRFDTLIVVTALIATIINSALKSLVRYTSRQILDIVFILRVLRLLRVVDGFKRFRAIINTLIRIGPAILTFGQLIIVVFYIFAMVGMELFKHKVKFYEDSNDPAKAYCGNPLLNNTAFAQLNYCKNNFNNVVSSFILLVELTVVNQWHVLSSGFATVTHVSARIFFVIFHILVVIIIVNIFVAFVLEAFFVEYSMDKNDLQTSLEKKIKELELAVAQEKLEDNLVNAMETMDNDLGTGQTSTTANLPNLMFKIASKRYRTVDALLQRMFEEDLDPEDFRETDEPEAQTGSFPNPAFGSA